MTGNLVLRAATIWVVIVGLAVGNGLVRENIIAPNLGEAFALPISGITLSIIVFIVTYFSFTFLGAKEKTSCLLIGAQWVVMTLAFEFIFGHYVAGKPWVEIIQVFNIVAGDLFTLVIIASLLSPYVVARIKGG